MHFNPRPREEGDYPCHQPLRRAFFISIHALVKRATLSKSRSVTFVVDDFNPRPREEGDQLTPQGLHRRWHFNPRPREEGDRLERDK